MNLVSFSFSESKFMNDVSYVSKATKYPRRPLTFREKIKHFFSGEYCIKYQPPEEISGKKTLFLDLDDTYFTHHLLHQTEIFIISDTTSITLYYVQDLRNF